MAKTGTIVDVDYQEFPGQREHEEVSLVLFKHWYTLVEPIVRSILIILASFVVPFWLGVADWIFSYGLSATIYYAWLVFWLVAIVYDYLNWSRDRYIITTERIIGIDQRGLFSRRVSEIELDRIQNVTHAVDGLFATAFNFGTITIQSAGANDLAVRQVPRPGEIQEEITRLVKEVTRGAQTQRQVKFIHE